MMKWILCAASLLVVASWRSDVSDLALVQFDSMYNPKSVQEAWDNHFDAFGKQNLDKIMLDYNEKSVAQVYNNADKTRSKFTGVAEIRRMFQGLFADLRDLASLAAPVVDIDEEGRQVFLVWKCPAMGYRTATDTFIFDGDFKIARQNIVVKKTAATALVEEVSTAEDESLTESKYKPQSVQDAWNNHFDAFGQQDLKKIMLDYDESSVARVFNNVGDSYQQFKGMKQIRAMFKGLFKDLSDLSTLDAPVVDVDEQGLQVFLVWECPGSGYETATDTFVFAPNFKISRQNIVVTKTKK
jgi:ketosteroid isomerase-like protein